MQAKLALIRDSIAKIQEQLVAFKATCPQEFLSFPEFDDLEMGLEWTAKRVDLIRIRLGAKEKGLPTAFLAQPCGGAACRQVEVTNKPA
jgi:hypothetical protein